jgi:hypothetical protein
MNPNDELPPCVETTEIDVRAIKPGAIWTKEDNGSSAFNTG